MKELFCTLGVTALLTAPALVYCLIDRCLTLHRLRVNQAEWDAFSSGMSESEKLEAYNNWCRESRIRHGWRHYYFPRV